MVYPKACLSLLLHLWPLLGLFIPRYSQLLLTVFYRYQHQLALLQAGRYGVPQNRERIIILASRGDIPLPDYPLPTHIFNRRATRKKLPNGEALQPIQRSGGKHPFQHDCLCAPLPAVTVDSYLDDLVSIFTIYFGTPLTLLQHSLLLVGLYSNITSFCYLTPHRDEPKPVSQIGFTKSTQYATPPKNTCQYFLRGGKTKVSQHYTKKCGSLTTERFVWQL